MGFSWWSAGPETAKPGLRVQDIVDRLQSERRRERQRSEAAAETERWPDRPRSAYAKFFATPDDTEV